jgi:hypothetical protein
MRTKKIKLSELKTLVKHMIKEEMENKTGRLSREDIEEIVYGYLAGAVEEINANDDGTRGFFEPENFTEEAKQKAREVVKEFLTYAGPGLAARGIRAEGGLVDFGTAIWKEIERPGRGFSEHEFVQSLRKIASKFEPMMVMPDNSDVERFGGDTKLYFDDY